MRVRRTFSLGGFAAATALALSGCAPGTTTSGTTSVAVPSIDPASLAGQTLDYMYFTDGPDLQATKAIIADFEKKYSVKVNIEVVPYADHVTTLQTRIAGNNPPDVARVTALSPFDGELLDLAPYLGSGFADEFIKEARPGFVGANGEIFGVPSDLTMNGIFVNTDLFAKAGVTVPTADKPWTWDHMVKAAKEVQAKTGTQYAFAIDKSGHRLSTILAQNDTFMIQGDKVTLDVTAATAALQPFIDMTSVNISPKDLWLESGSRYAGANAVFLAQQTPVYMSGNWQVAQFTKNATFGWAAAPNPCLKTCGGFPGGKFMTAFAGSKVKPLAAIFIQFVNNAKNQEAFLAATNFLPTRKDLAKNGVNYPLRQADMDVFLAEVGRTNEGAYAGAYSPLFDASSQAFVKQIAQVISGNKQLSTAIQDLLTDLKGIAARG
ncbi:MAG: hypothetical protein B5766_00785 [Candidatus Lumbricidophila eiseniae]|uniref:Sugar ABC transporter substrate-binding protein n=1 Tax=Candidatus Lumbricidiphila eiseniae TaxID=1969409 RepID=A0A2A6FU92_9MICO|nr:MAG: hypothetical protein B5766_00785 [Candidatus Lumbricidophila eiseniae]